MCNSYCRYTGNWFYIMTELTGDKSLRLMPGHTSIQMYGKGEYNDQGQYWRLEANGCLRNMEAKAKCLTIHGSYDGALVSMKDESNSDQQVWRYQKYSLKSDR